MQSCVTLVFDGKLDFFSLPKGDKEDVELSIRKNANYKHLTNYRFLRGKGFYFFARLANLRVVKAKPQDGKKVVGRPIKEPG